MGEDVVCESRFASPTPFSAPMPVGFPDVEPDSNVYPCSTLRLELFKIVPP